METTISIAESARDTNTNSTKRKREDDDDSDEIAQDPHTISDDNMQESSNISDGNLEEPGNVSSETMHEARDDPNENEQDSGSDFDDNEQHANNDSDEDEQGLGSSSLVVLSIQVLPLNEKEAVMRKLNQNLAIHKENTWLHAALGTHFPHLENAITASYVEHPPHYYYNAKSVDEFRRNQYHSQIKYDINLKALNQTACLNLMLYFGQTTYDLDQLNYESCLLITAEYGKHTAKFRCHEIMTCSFRGRYEHGGVKALFSKLLADLEASNPKTAEHGSSNAVHKRTDDEETERVKRLVDVFIPEDLLDCYWALQGGKLPNKTSLQIILEEISDDFEPSMRE